MELGLGGREARSFVGLPSALISLVAEIVCVPFSECADSTIDRSSRQQKAMGVYVECSWFMTDDAHWGPYLR